MKTQKIIAIGIALAVLLQLNIIVNKVKADDTPTITFVAADFANTLSVHTVSSSDVLWSDIEISGVYNISLLGTYVTPGNIILGCYGIITITYLPTSKLIGSWSFSPVPDITFSMDDNDNTLTVISVGVPDVFWHQIGISGNCNTYGLESYITPGNQITYCYGTISLTFTPTNTLLGQWEFSTQSSNGYLWGQVFGYTDDGSNYRLEDALITVKALNGQLVDSDYTNSDGCYYFYPIEIGTYNLQATKEGYLGAETLNVVIESGETTRINFDLPQIPGGPGWIYGWVSGINDNGTFPLGNALVTVRNFHGQFVDSIYTYPTGFYPIFCFEAGTYKVEISKDGYVGAETLNVVVEPGIGTEVDFILPEIGYPMSGRVYGMVSGTSVNDTFPLEDALVTIKTYEGQFVDSTYTNSYGYYSISDIDAGTYTVGASKDGYMMVETLNIVVDSGGVGTEVDFILPEIGYSQYGWIYGYVNIGKPLEGGLSVIMGPLENALVTVKNTLGKIVGSAYTNSEGYYEIKSLEVGTYNVEAKKEGYNTTVKSNILVLAGLGNMLSIHLSPSNGIYEEPIETHDWPDDIKIKTILINEAIEEGKVGGKIEIWEEQTNNFQHNISIYNGVEIKNLNIQKGSISFIVSGNETSGGKTIVINIDGSVFDQSSQILVNYDGKPINMADDIQDILNPNDDGSHAEYLVVLGSNGAQLLVSVPHFSEHTIEFFVQQVAQYLVYAVIFAVILVVIAAVVMFRKGKED